MKKIRIGTRGSRLAVIQAESVQKTLAELMPGYVFETLTISTRGDRILDAPLSKIGDKGLFTKELETALLEGEIDLAVHSMKDMPTTLPEGLKIGAVTLRHDPRDAFISRDGTKLADIPRGGTVATGSLRRAAQLSAYRPDLRIIDIRGNVQTRLKKMKESGNVSGTILARAGLERLEMNDVRSEIIEPDIMLPAVGQGALAIEMREHDDDTAAVIGKLNDDATYKAVMSERAFMFMLEGGCQVPIAGYAVITGNTLTLRGMVSSISGDRVIRDTLTGPVEKFREIGETLARKILDAGADKILKEIYRGET